MKRRIRTGATAGFLAIVLCSCSMGSKDSTTIVGPDGSTMTVDEKDGGATVKTGDTTASVGGAESVTEAEIGIPFYPGSTEKPNSSMKVDAPDAMTMFTARTTPDSIEKIKEFYEAKVPSMKFTIIDGPDGKSGMTSATLADGASVTVSAFRKAGESTTEMSLGYTKKK